MNPTSAPPGSGRWIPIRDRVTGRLLCEYDPHTGRIRVRRNRRYYTARVPIPPGPCPEGNPAPRDTCPEEAPASRDYSPCECGDPSPSGICPEETPVSRGYSPCECGDLGSRDTCPEETPVSRELAQAARQLLQQIHGDRPQIRDGDDPPESQSQEPAPHAPQP